MPVGFFALFVSLWGADSAGGIPVGASMLATFGTFGVVGVTLRASGLALPPWTVARRIGPTSLLGETGRRDLETPFRRIATEHERERPRGVRGNVVHLCAGFLY